MRQKALTSGLCLVRVYTGGPAQEASHEPDCAQVTHAPD